MKDRSVRRTAGRGQISGDIASYGLIIGAVVLAWQIAIQPFIQRAPPEAAIRLAPASPLVLRRAAESELAAGRTTNAAALGREALIRSPFDVRALRVIGLTEAQAGREDQADEILTLAGNWSLRDDPAHAWLVERRLRRGDYASAFAHADTLARRRLDIQPQVFRLFTIAGTQDPQRSVPVIARLLAAQPPWRGAYLTGLTQTPEGLQLLGSLAVLLEAGRAPFDNEELQLLYRGLLSSGQFEAIRTIREKTNRPSPSVAVTNGGFSETGAPQPFEWRLNQKVGIVPEIVVDDLRPSNSALRVDYDGYATGTVVEQLTSLPPGSYRVSTEIRLEAGDPTARLAWTLSCANTGDVIAVVPAQVKDAAQNNWDTLAHAFEIPNSCTAQWLRLETRAQDRRSPTVVWFDRLTIHPHLRADVSAR